LAELSFIDKDQLARCKDAVFLWINLMDFARQRSIVEFQDLADVFFELLIELKTSPRTRELFWLSRCRPPSLLSERVGKLVPISSAGLGEYECSHQEFLLQEDTAMQRSRRQKDEFKSKMAPIARWLKGNLYFLSSDYKNCN
jgi:hypothetical protein